RDLPHEGVQGRVRRSRARHSDRRDRDRLRQAAGQAVTVDQDRRPPSLGTAHPPWPVGRARPYGLGDVVAGGTSVGTVDGEPTRNSGSEVAAPESPTRGKATIA